MFLKFYEMAYQIALKCDISVKTMNELISSGINDTICSVDALRKLHSDTCIKGYGFFIKDLLPLKTGDVCTLVIRCIGKELAENLQIAFEDAENNYFSVIGLKYVRSKIKNEHKKIFAVKSLTPTVITNVKLEKGRQYLDFTASPESIKAAINAGLSKRYSMISGTSVNHDCIKAIKTLNKPSIVAKYKEGCIIGNKYIIVFRDDNISQDMAFIAANLGIGEKNSLGFGMTNANNDYVYELLGGE